MFRRKHNTNDCIWRHYLNLFIYYCFFGFVSEIGKVRGNLFQINGKKNEPLVLPDATGAPVSLSEKVYVPLKDHPDVSSP
jgi:hypothetical protein